MSRLATVTEKVPTPFGSLYAHVSTDDAGAVACDVAVSTPGKHYDTTVYDTFVAFAATDHRLPARRSKPDDEAPA